MLEFSMFGDPTLSIEDGDDPESVARTIPLFLQILERIINRIPLIERIFTILLQLM